MEENQGKHNEFLEKLRSMIEQDSQARLAPFQAAITVISKQVEDQKSVVTKATSLNLEINFLEEQVAKKKLCKDYVASETVQEYQKQIQLKEDLLESLKYTQQQIQSGLPYTAFLKELIEVKQQYHPFTLRVVRLTGWSKRLREPVWVQVL